MTKLNFPSDNLDTVLRTLGSNGGKPRIIGGTVRDAILGIPSNDIDVVTTLPPDQILTIFAAKNIKTIAVGYAFGTVIVVINKEKFEITTLRKDTQCDGRHTLVEFTDDFQIDAQRRDFTINAISYCPFTHKLYDYFHGLDDLRNRKVRFIGDPTERIAEDYLRILRFFRFSTYYASSLDPAGYEACAQNKHGIATLSRERINLEMDKILHSTTDTSQTIQAMNDCGIQVFSPLHADAADLHRLYQISDTLGITPTLQLKYAVLIAKNSNLSSSALKTLFISTKMAQCIESLASLMHSDDAALAIKTLFVDHQDIGSHILFASVFDKITASEATTLLTLAKNARPTFPVSAQELMSRGLNGSALGSAIKMLKEIWVKSDFTLTKDELLKLLHHLPKLTVQK